MNKNFLPARKLGKYRELAFTCSKHRPYHIQSCIQQLQNQTYPIHHSVFINSEIPNKINDPYNYLTLLNPAQENYNISLGYGLTESQHVNHLTALSMVSLDDYDLFFCKIDDDDLYNPKYIEDLVNDYIENKWDFSGSFSDGIILDSKWQPKRKVSFLGLDTPPLPIPNMLASTYSFTRKALDIILSLENFSGYEDPKWRRALSEQKDIKIHLETYLTIYTTYTVKNTSTFNQDPINNISL